MLVCLICGLVRGEDFPVWICSSYLLNTATLLPVSIQLLPQSLILHQQQLYLVGLLQTSRWQAVECVVAGGFCWLTRLDIPKRCM